MTSWHIEYLKLKEFEKIIEPPPLQTPPREMSSLYPEKKKALKQRDTKKNPNKQAWLSFT